MEFIEVLKVILLGIVEGITEWLPVSSTGHMILLEKLFPLKASEAFKEMFFVVIQLGAILAVIVMFFKKLFPFSLQKEKDEQAEVLQTAYSPRAALSADVLLYRASVVLPRAYTDNVCGRARKIDVEPD